jgi:Tfp pilus assembly protein PilX
MIGRLRQDESGWALVTCVIVMTLLLGIGLAGLSLVDGQARQSGRERVGESAFNFAQGALKSELVLVSRSWPGAIDSAYPGTCSSTVQGANCPDGATLAAQFAGSDYAGASWTAALQDNGGSVGSYYTTAGAASQPSYDANGDGKLWLRASATTRGASRAIVTLVAAQAVPIPFPHASVLADHFAVTNAGAKVLVDTDGSTYLDNPGQPGPVTVRCSAPAPSSTCLDYDPSKPQVSPPAIDPGYPTLTAVSAEQLNQMRSIAKAAGNTCGASGSSPCYYASGCPTNPSGAHVFIESGNCIYGGGTYNSLASPGMLVIATGTLSLGGNATFHGLVYAANLQHSTGNVVDLSGTSEIIGAVAVDGSGGVRAGSAGPSIAYNPNVFSLAQGYGNATPVKGTWRELVGSA